MKKQLFGCLSQALLGNFLIGALAWALGTLLGGPKIYIETTSAIYTFFILLGFCLIVIGWSIFVLAKYQVSQNFTTSGPYKFVRHPIYSAIIFLLNPALAILFQSWLLFLAIIPFYFIWKKAIQNEEKYLEEKFGQNYRLYKNTAWPFFPNWRRINPHTKFGVGVNKILFYALTGIVIFIVAFVSLNFSAVYLRWVTFQKHEKITYDDNSKIQPSPTYFQQMFESGLVRTPANQENQLNYKPNYSEQLNFIIISKINVRAPLIFATGATQKELNQALNQGVIIYPGSALPGQNGEVFLSGHSSSFPWVKTQYGQVFTLLDKLETGDIVSLIYDHYQYDYHIISKQILAPKDTKITATNKPTLTLMTCWPIGTALKRLVVRGELIK